MDFIKYEHSSNNTPPDCVQPLVQWQHHLTPKSSGVPISCNWRINRDRYLHTAEELPSGWERHSIDPSLLPSEASDVDGSDFVFDHSKSTPKCFYTHRNAPDEQFWYPLPLPDPEDPFTVPIYAPFISSRTRRARLFPAGRLTADQKGRNNSNRPLKPNELPPCGATLSEFSFSIRDGKGSWAGVLLPNKEPLPEWTHSANETVELELVEIPLGNIPNDSMDIYELEEGYLEERPDTGDTYEYYHVWIEWEDGIAYRKGLGRMVKDRWEAQDREWLDMILD